MGSNATLVFRFLLFLTTALAADRACAQGLEPRLYFSWGTNILTSPGADITTSPGRTGSLGAAITVGNGWESKLRLVPAFSYTGSTYRTLMDYRSYFAVIRTSYQLDVMVGFRQMNGATLFVGPFYGWVRKAKAAYEQGSKNTYIQGGTTGRIMAEHYPNLREAGFVLGYSFPLDSKKRFGLILLFRQHIIPLVDKDQYYALQFSPDQQVLSTDTRASIFSVGLHYRFK